VNRERAYPGPNDDWWIVGPGKGMCKSCGEERLVTKVQDFRGIQMFCQVCSRSWWYIGRDKPWRSAADADR
jgi:hypothetical protein